MHIGDYVIGMFSVTVFNQVDYRLPLDMASFYEGTFVHHRNGYNVQPTHSSFSGQISMINWVLIPHIPSENFWKAQLMLPRPFSI